MSIRHWPATERPREKLLDRGATALSDAELLAIFLRTGIAGTDAVTLARQLLNQFGSLRRLLGASQADFCSAKGLGEAKFVQLQAVLEMSRRALGEDVDDGRGRHAGQSTWPQRHLREPRLPTRREFTDGGAMPVWCLQQQATLQPARLLGPRGQGVGSHGAGGCASSSR